MVKKVDGLSLATLALLASSGVALESDTYRLRPQPSFPSIFSKDDERSGHFDMKRGGGKRNAKKVARRKMAKASRKRNR